MEKKRESPLKNFVLLLVIIAFSKYANANKNMQQQEISSPNPIATENQIVKSINSQVNFDKNKGSCDLTNISETVHFTFKKPTNIIHHLIFSTKFSYYNFRVHLNNFSDIPAGVEIAGVKTFSNTSLKKSFLSNFLNREMNNNNFKENWLIAIRLSKPVKEISLKFLYNISNSLHIDPMLKTNILHYQYINPYNYQIDEFSMKINIINYSELNKYSIKSPNEGSINDLENKKGIVIDIQKSLPKVSMYSINLPLPYKLDMCDKGFFNTISVTLLVMTFIITGFGFFTCFKISKD